jgi:hypothetical protein
MSRIAEAAYGSTPAPYPNGPGYKELTTSRDAAVAVAASSPLLRERVYAAIKGTGARGMTPDEAAAAVGKTIMAVRPRVTELAKASRIVPTGERRANESGLKAKVWKAI